MNGVNSVHIAGLVTQPVELRHDKNGKPVVTLTIATKYNGTTSHHRAVVFGKATDFVASSIKRNDLVYVMGPLIYRQFTNDAGETHVSAEILALQVQSLDKGNYNGEQPRDYADENWGNR